MFIRACYTKRKTQFIEHQGLAQIQSRSCKQIGNDTKRDLEKAITN